MTEEIECPAILPALRRGIIHSTSRDSLVGIFETKAILPNHGQLNHCNSYPLHAFQGGRNGYICLFDFETPTEQECLKHYSGKWGNVLRQHTPITIAIRLQRSAISHLIPNSNPQKVRNEHGVLMVPQYIPKVEVWSAKPIPTSAILAYIVIDATDIEKFWGFSASGDDRADLAAIDSIARDFQKDRK